MHNSALVIIHMIDTAAKMGVPRCFSSSSTCLYRDMQPGEPEMSEEEAIPANPDNEYGWEKLYAERVAMAYGRRYPMQERIARFQNCYGPERTWTGGREKAPPPPAVKWPRPRMALRHFLRSQDKAARSRSGAMGRPFVPIPTWGIWWMQSIC